ncbi:UDP-N-acetylmuramoyl-L-alanyl-D-glutamate--2,6-diaminopimelate ligase [Bacillus massiliglaciei]|uniref:UDP-N-acetylmuramoyl-L-alanyl-D-glutamate--2, 6-diaminopimelate ligase n=1 Tax=Bacillus massiliglaciei TaxID=1816693 RepID=UPI000AD8CFB1|nr:UDP-N-acetylmuramoyl-L-alanyl-D-glutamate--2,6-diaminopimelate ligase [Bacillus massiliglaciei]
MKLRALLSNLNSLSPFTGEDPEITSVENDNRKVKQGSLFICVKGFTVDGHDFAESAVRNGAAAVVAEKPLPLDVPVIIVRDTQRAMAVLADAFYGHPTQHFRLIGITGTNGKTTTSHLIEKIFADKGEKTGLIGTMYTKIADKEYETKNTTPDSVTLQQTFYEMKKEAVGTAVMEVSSHALEQGRVHGCDFDIAVFTNLTQDHLDFHKTMERYKFAKSLLFSQLGNTYREERPKYAVLNADDEAAEDLIKATAANVITYAIDKPADVRALDVRITAEGTSFMLQTEKESMEVSLQLIGKFSVYNALAAASAALCAGIPLAEIINSLEQVQGVSGRFEPVSAGQSFPVIVDYAHTPDSLENVLMTVKEFVKGNIYVVVGCGGGRDKKKSPLMAEIACRIATHPVFTSDNPRSEDPVQILQDMKEGASGNYLVLEDRREAIGYAVEQAQEGDVVIIAGKGHETYQDINGSKTHFDDREEARKAIKKRFS